jgi:MFS transporter, DHA1 family, tetracycline resistance protein
VTTDPPAAESPPPTGSRSALITVFLVVFIDLLGFGIVLPLLPLYADDLLLPLFPGQENAVFRGAMLGLLMASFSLMQFLFAPSWGRLSDRIGRRPILLLGLAGSVIFYALFGIASEIGEANRAAPDHSWLIAAIVLLFVSRLGAGVAGATISTAQAVIADTTTPDKRARGMALIGAAFGIGFTFGPLLGLASLFLPFAGAPGYLASALSLVAFLYGWRKMPETRTAAAPVSEHLRRRIMDMSGTARVLRTPQVGILVATFFLATFAFGSLESTLALVNRLLLTGEDLTRAQRAALLTREAVKTTEQANFAVFAFVGFVLIIMQGFVYRRFVQKVGEVRFLRMGIVFMAAGLLGGVGVLLWRPGFEAALGSTSPTELSVWPRWPLLGSGLVAMTLAVIGFALLTPSAQALISKRGDPNRQGEVLGVNQSASAMARILGPFLGLSMFDMVPTHILPFAVGAGLLGFVFLLSLAIRHD